MTGCSFLDNTVGVVVNSIANIYKSSDYYLNKQKNLAEQGDANAQYELGEMYYHGKSLPKNNALALEWLEKSAKQNNLYAQHLLGSMYYLGHGVTQDFEKALQYFYQSASQGITQSQYNLCVMYYKGEGVTQDYKQAFEWCKLSAQKSNSSAEYVLSMMYYYGHGVEKNNDLGLTGLKKSCHHGVHIACGALEEIKQQNLSLK